MQGFTDNLQLTLASTQDRGGKHNNKKVLGGNVLVSTAGGTALCQLFLKAVVIKKPNGINLN